MRVLVTRPEQGGARTAERLVELGIQPVLLPLTRTEPLALPVGIDFTAFDAVAVTSANALRHAAPPTLDLIRGLACFTVGRETANAAERRGFTRITVGDGDAPALARTITRELRRGARLLYLCGRLRRSAFEQLLGRAGIAVTAIETYDTLAIDYTPEEVANHIGQPAIDCVLVYSVEAAIALLRLIRSIAAHSFVPRTRFFCISPRVAALLAGQGLEIVVARDPTEASLLSALRDISSKQP